MKYLKNVTTLTLDSVKCISCGMCMEVCPRRVFDRGETGIRIIDKDRCMECGACKRNCPVQALNVEAGVGCAYAIVMGKLKNTEPTCGCDGPESGCC